MADMVDIVAGALHRHAEETGRGAEWVELHPIDAIALRKCAGFVETGVTHDGVTRFLGARVHETTDVSMGSPHAGHATLVTGRFDGRPDAISALAAHLLAGRSLAAFAMEHAGDGHDPLPAAWARSENTSAMLTVVWCVLGSAVAHECTARVGVMGARRDGTLTMDHRLVARACREIRARIRDHVPELTLPDLTRAMRG